MNKTTLSKFNVFIGENKQAVIEIWKTIPEFPEYEASSLGRVRRATSGRLARAGYIMKQRLNKHTGYLNTGLYKNGGSFDKAVHVLVASAFLGERPTNYVVNHKDGVKTNNRPENLEYITHAQNIQHAARLGLFINGNKNGSRTKPERYPRGEKRWGAKLNDDSVREIRKSLAENCPGKILAERFGVNEKQISNIRLGKTWKHVK
jgi:hypothetical protein